MNVNFKVNLELYKVFYMAALLGSMTRTAEKLYIGQPAVSKSIKTLEEELGCTLFVRGSRGLELTREGAVLLEHIAQAMEQIRLAEDTLLRLHGRAVRTVKIEICAMQFKLLILPHLKTFYEQCSKSAYDISPTTDTYASLRRLEEGAIDCCILTRPMDVGRFRFIRLFTFHDYLIGSPEYLNGLADGGDLAEHLTLISVMNRSIMSSYEQMRLKSLKLHNTMKVSSMDHTIALAKLGHGVGFIAEELVREELSNEQLIKVDLPVTQHRREVGFLLGEHAEVADPLLEFIDYFRAIYVPQPDEPLPVSRRA